MAHSGSQLEALTGRPSASLAESVEERLFAALRREVLPYAQPKELANLTREIWLLEEELANGHPFFLQKQRRAQEATRRTRAAFKGEADTCPAAFEAEVARALLGLDHLDWPVPAAAAGEVAEEAESRCSTEVPSPQPPSPSEVPCSKEVGGPDFWLPVLRRCLTQEHDADVRGRLVQDIWAMEARGRLPSAHDLAACAEAPLRRSLLKRCTWPAVARDADEADDSGDEGRVQHTVSWRKFSE